MNTTRELVELCNISKEKYILNVGCGVGASSCYLARKYGSRVLGVDISKAMIEKSHERVKKRKLTGNVKFILADAINLPFHNNTFDIVISESVNAFIEERKIAIEEYKRVCKLCGYVGLNEVTWNKPNPPNELQKYLTQAMGIREILTNRGWRRLLEECGFKEVKSNCYRLNIIRQWIEEVRTPGIRDTIQAWFKFFNIYLKDRKFRNYARQLYPSFRIIIEILNYFGYCLYLAKNG